MAGFWSVVLPAAATNLVPNPSFETNTTSWAAISGGAVARTADQQRRGAWSGRYTPTANTIDGIRSIAITVSTATAYVFSIDVLGVLGVPYQLEASNGGVFVANFTGTGAWQRVELTWTTVSTSVQLAVRKNGSTSIAPFYIDGVQLETGSAATTYLDGDQPGCSWSGTVHGSTSSRSAQSRAGGTLVNLDDYGMVVQQLGGVGMPPMDVISLVNGFADGSFYQRSRSKERPATLQITATGESQANLHSIRKQLIDAIKPDRVATPQPIQFRYDGTGGDTMLIDLVYDAGLDYGSQRGFLQNIPLRFLAPDPFWRLDGSAGASLSVSSTVANANYIAQRSDAGVWAAISTGMNGSITALAIGPDGTLYAGGGFTTAGGVAAAGVARWTGSAWAAMGSGAIGGFVSALAVGPDGTVYAGGTFTNMGGIANTNRIARWTGSAWNSMGTGAAGGSVAEIVVGLDGAVYAGGDFTSMGGVANTLRIAKWSSSAWSAMGTGIDNSVEALAVGLDGSIYAGGSFTLAGGVANTLRVARWTGSAWSAMGTGANGTVQEIAVGLDGTVYAGGAMTTLGGVSVAGIGAWNGAAWSALGTGLNAIPYSMVVGADGDLIVGGAFTTAGGAVLPDSVARWTGSAWVALDINLPGTATVFALATRQGVLTVGYDTSGSATAATVTTVTNAGTATTYPTITLVATAAAQVYQILNTTTGQELFFTNLTMQAGETIVIDCTPGAKTITSSFRGNLLQTVAAGSNLATFALLPGSNTLSVFAASGVAAWASWPIRHWSIDGGAL